MATNTPADNLPRPAIGFCKKCNTEHEKPTGNKCEKSKNVKEEKRDLSRETIKKTSKGKAADSHDKMMELMLNTMNSVTEKLASMDERISGLASRMDTPTIKPSTRKSCSQEQVKRRGISESEAALFGSPPTTHAVIQDGGTAYSQVFAAVAIKPTPARPKKQKSTIDLGCTPILQTTTSHLTSTVTSQMRSQPKTSTVTFQTLSQPVTESVGQSQHSGVQTWHATKDIPRQPAEVVPTVKESIPQDCNQNVLFGHVDQFGNPVSVQGSVAPAVETRKTFVPVTEHPIVADVGATPSIDVLRSNPLIQQMVGEDGVT